jgi:hypothetical protein
VQSARHHTLAPALLGVEAHTDRAALATVAPRQEDLGPVVVGLLERDLAAGRVGDQLVEVLGPEDQRRETM